MEEDLSVAAVLVWLEEHDSVVEDVHVDPCEVHPFVGF